MSKLNVDQKCILDLFSYKNTDFLIPDYQRPYAWTEEQCQTLWNDLYEFAIPDNDPDNFESNQEYFLGPIVTFKNKHDKIEVIDGQQRLTTLMLLLRAFYQRSSKMVDKKSLSINKSIEKCIWKTSEFDDFDKENLKIDSQVATDNDKEEFLEILRTGNVTREQNSRYAKNYRLFQNVIDQFINEAPSHFVYLPNRILKNCILLPIEAESQDTALRIFSTLNDRGLPLSDSDIFKAQLYKHYSLIHLKDEFIERWKMLEEVAIKNFGPDNSAAMDELFSLYMYYLRAKEGIKLSTTEALRRFYEKDNFRYFHDEKLLGDLEILAQFWNDINTQNTDRFSEQVLKDLFILKYSPNAMWMNFLSVYFMENKDESGLLENDKLHEFLNLTTLFILAYSLTNPGVNALRTPIYAAMIKVVNQEPVTFEDFKFDENNLRKIYSTSEFGNIRPITKSFLTWWAYKDPNQCLLDTDENFQIEHIYSRNRKNYLKDSKHIELLGNKSILESKINIRASDYRFADKKTYYLGTARKNKAGTKIAEILNLSEKNDFDENSILERNQMIIDSFIKDLKDHNLISSPLN